MSLTYSVGILGKLNINSLKQGLQQTKQNLEETDAQAKKTGTTMDRFQKGIKGGLGGLRNLSLAAAGALTAIGLSAPALAGPMAKIRNEMFQTSNIIGKELKPQFEGFANAWGRFNQFLEANPTMTRIGSQALGLVGALGILSGAWKALKWLLGPIFTGLGKVATALGITGLVKKVGGAIGAFVTGKGAAFLGWLAGIPALAAGVVGAVGAIGGQALQWLGEKLGLLDPRGTGWWDVTKRIGTNVLGGAAAGAGAGALIGAFGGPIGAGAGALIGGAGGLLFSGGKEIWQATTGRGAYDRSQDQPINITQPIILDGREIGRHTNQYMVGNYSYLPGGGQ